MTVGLAVGTLDVVWNGDAVGLRVILKEGLRVVGFKVGNNVGLTDGSFVGFMVGASVGSRAGLNVGTLVGVRVGRNEGTLVGK